MSGFPTSFSGCNPNIKEKALGTRLPVPVTDNREKCTTNARGHGGGGGNGVGTVEIDWCIIISSADDKFRKSPQQLTLQTKKV